MRHHSVTISKSHLSVENPGVPLPGYAGQSFLAKANMHIGPRIAARARAYARDGNIRKIIYQDNTVSAFIMGQGDLYDTEITGLETSSAVTASCTCYYQCSPRNWCKHATALAYVIAAILDGEVKGDKSFVLNNQNFTALNQVSAHQQAQQKAKDQELAAQTKALTVALQNAQILKIPADITAFDSQATFEKACLWLEFPSTQSNSE